jgi:pyrroline-5-carboxylate reductase
MTQETIGFIGGGRITTIFLGGWQRAGALPRRIVVADADPQVLARLQTQHPGIETCGSELTKPMAQDTVFIALHPPAIAETLTSARAALRPDAVVVSLAPKFTLAKLTTLLGGFQRVARVLPNAPSIVGAGFNPLTFSAALPPDDRARLTQLLAPLGQCPEVAEAKLEAYAVVAAMGPTYFWPQWHELQTLGTSFGLTPAEAAEAVREMLLGALRTLQDSGLSPQQVMDLIPVKPLGDLEPTILAGYRTKLQAVMDRIRP